MWQNSLKIYLNQLYENKSNLIEFKSFTFDYQRVCFCLNKLNLPNEKDTASIWKFYEINNESHKSKELSDKYRNIGNNFYKKKEFINSFENYLLALKHAPAKSDQLLLAYSNRSALFYELKLYRECLNDLNQMKFLNSNKYPENLEEKLTNRENNCLSSLSVLNDDDLNKVENDILTTPHHSKYIHMSENLDVKYEKQRGRYCVAKKHESLKEINAGEILFHEKPYCSILLPEYQNFYCENCYKEIYEKNFKYLNIEYCDTCINVIYCSRKCKLESANYHKHECFILKLLYDLGIAHLAYRVIAKTSFEMLTMKFKDKIKFESTLESYYKNQDQYRSCDYETIFNLVSNSSDTHVDDLFQYTLTSILLSKLYFLNHKDSNLENIILIATLLSRHIQQAICNAHAITKLAYNYPVDDDTATYSYEQVRFATALYPTVSLMNHSCDPNVICSFKVDSNEIIIKSSKLITLNENEETQIWNCYGPHYLKMSYLERKSVLNEQYHFNCECKYCLIENGKFDLDENNIYNFGFKCMSCEKHLNELNCKNCNVKSFLNEYKIKLCEIKNLLNKNDLKSLMNCLKLHEGVFLPIKYYEINKLNNVENYFYLINYCKLLDRLARCLCETRDFEKAATYLRNSINLLIFIYNDEFNIEIAIELFKLSEVLCNCGKIKDALESVDAAIKIADKISHKKSQLNEQLRELRENILNLLMK